MSDLVKIWKTSFAAAFLVFVLSICLVTVSWVIIRAAGGIITVEVTVEKYYSHRLNCPLKNKA